jgi:hypothetical protein
MPARARLHSVTPSYCSAENPCDTGTFSKQGAPVTRWDRSRQAGLDPDWNFSVESRRGARVPRDPRRAFLGVHDER